MMRPVRSHKTALFISLLSLLTIGCSAFPGANDSNPKMISSNAESVATPSQANTVNIVSTAASKTLALGPGDIFEIRVYNEKDISNIYRVSNSGHIDFPLLGSIKVDSLTSNQLVGVLETKLKEFLKNPQVSVFIKEFHSKKVYVFGQVRKPGTFTYEENMNIIQAITLAGGLQPLADPNGTFVNRVVNGAEQKIKVAVKDIGKGEAPNIVLQPGDIIYVPESLF